MAICRESDVGALVVAALVGIFVIVVLNEVSRHHLIIRYGILSVARVAHVAGSVGHNLV